RRDANTKSEVSHHIHKIRPGYRTERGGNHRNAYCGAPLFIRGQISPCISSLKNGCGSCTVNQQGSEKQKYIAQNSSKDDTDCSEPTGQETCRKAHAPSKVVGQFADCHCCSCRSKCEQCSRQSGKCIGTKHFFGQ